MPNTAHRVELDGNRQIKTVHAKTHLADKKRKKEKANQYIMDKKERYFPNTYSALSFSSHQWRHLVWGLELQPHPVV